MAVKGRPTGLTVLTILCIVLGIIHWTVVFFLSSSDLASAWLAIDWLFRGSSAFLGTVALVFAYGLLGSRGWAWILGLIFGIGETVVGLILLPGGIIRIAYGLPIVYYLSRPHVKAFFGKAKEGGPQ